MPARLPLLTRLASSLSCEPAPENSQPCWLWTGKKILVRGGSVRKQRIFKNGQLDDIRFVSTKEHARIPQVALNGKRDHPARQLYRHFIGEPPVRTIRLCTHSDCCNPFHLKADPNPPTVNTNPNHRPRGRPRLDLLARVTPNLSCEPSPENKETCWTWVGKLALYRHKQGWKKSWHVKGTSKRNKAAKRVNIDEDQIYWKYELRQQIPMLSYNGKLDTPARQLYRHFIGEPPNPVERTCGIALCCNPWHLTRGVSYQEIRQQAFQELENARKAQLESAFHEPVSEDQEIEELAEMICEHWQRHPKAMLPQLTEHFGEDYDDETVRKATRWASLEMDGCPPVIRRELDVLLGITPEDRSR